LAFGLGLVNHQFSLSFGLSGELLNWTRLLIVSIPYIGAMLLLYGLLRIILKFLSHVAPESKLRQLLMKVTVDHIESTLVLSLLLCAIGLTFYYA
jgi:hypothetical protein